MNYLAHFLLSKESPSSLVGNYVGEMVTVKDFDKYAEPIKEGIFFHNAVDHFTHNHPVVLKSRQRLNNKYYKYGKTIIDIYFDHFLAANWSQYSEVPLEEFTTECYNTLLEYHSILPYKAKYLLPYLVSSNWLLNFQTVAGLHQALKDMDRRSSLSFPVMYIIEDLIEKYAYFKEDFFEFFPELLNHITELKATTEKYENLVGAKSY
ncbi:MAG: ACP phosphodiesterase [Cytophagaceae bacterium]